MKNKGFTLVELLAVIAILAILVIIALPNVLKMFNDSKKNSFLTEAKTVYSEVSKKYITESMKGNKLTYISSEDDTKLNMTGKELQYCVLLNSDGSVSEMSVSNGTWVATLPKGKKITDLNASNVTEGNLDGYKCGNGSGGGSKPFDQEDSWEVIASNAKNCVENPDSCAYKVGDTKTVKLNDKDYTVRIANMSTPDECKQEGFSQSACGFVIEFVDRVNTFIMNFATTTKGGWPASSMYKYLNNESVEENSGENSIISKLPNDLKKVIIDTTTISGHGSRDNVDYISKDKLYLLAPKEIYDDWSNQYDTAKDKTRQLDYYKNNGVTTSNRSGAVKYYNGSAVSWWLRSASTDSSGYFFFCITSGGVVQSGYGNATLSVFPAFRIG